MAQDDRPRAWGAGAIAGLVGGIGMGTVLHVGTDVMASIGALAGVESVPAGWIVHLFIATAFGVLFVAIFDRPFFDELRTTVSGCLSIGVVHSAALGLLTGGLVLPASIALSGGSSLPIATLPLPGVTAGIEVGVVIAVSHLVYGLLLGGTFAHRVGAEVDVPWWPARTVEG